ncbi:MAG: death-on-curing protein [Melioribacteraceae bacterium]|nr:MAG: death-on-curing protein [Melioribacteraceae bacterium]
MRTYLNVEDVLTIYENLIREFGGINGLRDKAALEAAVNRPITGYYDDIIEEASALMESLTKNHCFIDGNKRIAFFATDIFLRINGYKINCKPDDGHKFFIKNLEDHTFTYETIINWLSDKIIKDI